MKESALKTVIDRLSRLAEEASASAAPAYRVPGLWSEPAGHDAAARAVEPAAYYRTALQSIAEGEARPPVRDPSRPPGDWGQRATAYNLLVRYGAAFDHDGDGRISPEPSASGWRDTGTFLKATALLPYIRSLGCDVIHLLPITSIGRDGNKGDMGSAFAIRDPYALDEHLAEPALGLGVETEFAAFVEAAHRLGIRIVVEFVFRTAAKDAAWAAEHPEWFYWIRADVPDRRPGEEDREDAYGAPLFTGDELHAIYDAVGQGRFGDLLPPHDVYRRMFLPPPPPDTVRKAGLGWIGTSRDPETGAPVDVRIPGAFCDWGPDSRQPPWTDVTYLRLYDHPDFNYIAYNTVRMYDAHLARPENAVAPLWEKICEVIPHYQRRYGVDGVMIDMGHALPGDLKRRLVARAREVDPDFALWAEEFNLSPEARAEGYNVCVGPFMQTVRDPERWRGWLRWIHGAGIPVPFMAMAENHNTPRANWWAGGNAYVRYAQTLGALLPGVPYLHNGIEFGDRTPVNTGFDFSDEQVAQWPPARLPLFSAAALDWEHPDFALLDAIRGIHAFRREHLDLFADPAPGTIIPLETANRAVTGYIRQKPGSRGGIAVLGNTDMEHPQPLVPPHSGARADLLAGGAPLPETLAPAQVVAYEI